jgi:phosphoglycerol transferase MdoB-like AlkP superfamily enzyme
MINILAWSIGLILLYIALVITWVIIWIITLVHEYNRKKIIFFILTLVFPVVLIIYWIVWVSNKKFRKTKRR